MTIQMGIYAAMGWLLISLGFTLLALYELHALATRKERPITYQVREQIDRHAHLWFIFFITLAFLSGAVFSHFWWR